MTEALERATFRARQKKALRDIVIASLDGIPLEEIGDDFHSGELVSIYAPQHEIMGRVEFDRRHLKVSMFAPFPVRSEEHLMYDDRISFFKRHPTGVLMTADGSDGGAASKECLEEAFRLLKELYCDWAILYMQRDLLKDKYKRFEEILPTLEAEEKKRREKLKSSIAPLSEKSHELKERLKHGEIRQEEYVKEKAPIRSELSHLQAELQRRRDFFREFFWDEIMLCDAAARPEDIIREIALMEEGEELGVSY